MKWNNELCVKLAIIEFNKNDPSIKQRYINV